MPRDRREGWPSLGDSLGTLVITSAAAVLGLAEQSHAPRDVG